MKITSGVPRAVVDESMGSLDEGAVQRLGQLIKDIGVARFEGRISAGFVDPDAGYVALGRFVAEQKQRSVLSDLTDVIFARTRREL